LPNEEEGHSLAQPTSLELLSPFVEVPLSVVGIGLAPEVENAVKYC